MLRVLVKNVEGKADVDVEYSEVAGRLTLVGVKGGGGTGVETLTGVVESDEATVVAGTEL